MPSYRALYLRPPPTWATPQGFSGALWVLHSILPPVDSLAPWSAPQVPPVDDLQLDTCESLYVCFGDTSIVGSLLVCSPVRPLLSSRIPPQHLSLLPLALPLPVLQPVCRTLSEAGPVFYFLKFAPVLCFLGAPPVALCLLRCPFDSYCRYTGLDVIKPRAIIRVWCPIMAHAAAPASRRVTVFCDIL